MTNMLDKHERSSIMVSMNKLSNKERAQIISCLVEGNSIRGTARITGRSKNTVVKLLADVGNACLDYQDKHLRHLKCKQVQVDEIWSFCYAKQRNVPEQFKDEAGYGDVWTFTAICADTKIVPCWMVGNRDGITAYEFMFNLAGRIDVRFQLTTDGWKPYQEVVEAVFAGDVDYAQLIKTYGKTDTKSPDRKYSPPEFVCASKRPINGWPLEDKISTSYIERQNLTMRMSMRRFARLTNAFSKKVENLAHAVSLHFMYYNFARIHKSLRVTPAMEAGVSDHVWELEEIAQLIDSYPQAK